MRAAGPSRSTSSAVLHLPPAIDSSLPPELIVRGAAGGRRGICWTCSAQRIVLLAWRLGGPLLFVIALGWGCFAVARARFAARERAVLLLFALIRATWSKAVSENSCASCARRARFSWC